LETSTRGLEGNLADGQELSNRRTTMNYFTKLIERLGKGSRIDTVPAKTPEGSAPTNRVEPIEQPAEQGRP